MELFTTGCCRCKKFTKEHRQAHRREVPWGLLKYPETTSSSRSISIVNSWELKDHLVKVLYTLLLFLQPSLRIPLWLTPEEDYCAWRTINLNSLWPFLFLCFVLINKHNTLQAYLLEGILKQSLSGYVDFHMTWQCIRL